MPTNDNYVETKDGWVRRDNVPDAQRSRVKWDRLKNIEAARQSVAELREQQNQRNEEYRKRHGDG